ncbi:FAD:protein FMN transferase [Coralloluteibacterium stylophorae]|uniref:FAD:protein FMN transferase n=1 Tax=Coralloluteibacterium stylophorae TaxID=1776034 RepID=A0A8J8AZB4_9GAMM|nr:FAD:protein FMN transferase [Coralloluteibacterium stylophorae]MBS7457126.1 FAD:protein FMN transferase [Coralloluteibacterium stylophorae]
MHRLLALLPVLASLLVGCATAPAADAGAAPPVLKRIAGEAMGTTWSVQAVVPAGVDTATLRAAVEAVLDGIDRDMSAWRSDSALSRFNRAPAGSRVHLPPDLVAVLDYGLALAEDTGGAYDPSVGALVEAWGFSTGTRRQAPPDAASLAAARARVGWRRLRLDAAGGTLVQPGGVTLDVNAIAPGHAVDRVAARLAALGASAWLVELGGEFAAHGRKPDGQPWRIAVELPPGAQADDLAAAIVELDDRAAGSSGDYRDYFEYAGVRYAHTLDPRSGAPVVHALAAVTVLDATAMRADAQAAALMVLGPDQGWAWAQARGLAAVFVIRRDAGFDVRMTPAFERALAR